MQPSIQQTNMGATSYNSANKYTDELGEGTQIVGSLFPDHHLFREQEGEEAEKTRLVSTGHVQYLHHQLQNYSAGLESIQEEKVVLFNTGRGSEHQELFESEMASHNQSAGQAQITTHWHAYSERSD